MKKPKRCSCGCLDLDHELSQVYSFYHCIKCEITCCSSNFNPILKSELTDYTKKYRQLKRQKALC